MITQYDLEHWWVELYRTNGIARSQRLRKSDRISSDTILRKRIRQETFKLFKRTVAEMLTPRGANGQLSESAVYILKIMESMEGLALSHLVISAALNHLLGSKATETSLAAIGGSIVRAVEVELRIRFIEKVYPQLAAHWQKAGGTFTHRNKALMSLAGRASRSGLPRFFADTDTKGRLGLALAEMLLLSNIVEPYVFRRGTKPIWSVRVKPDVVNLFNRAVSLDDFLSMVPPLGIYLAPPDPDRTNEPGVLMERRPIVSNNWLSGQGTPNPPPSLIYECIHRLNSVRYVVNEEMLRWIRDHQKFLEANGTIPRMELKIRESDNPAEAHTRFAKEEPKRSQYLRTLNLAERLIGHGFHHDWFIDFRGRMYTTGTFLSPQGTPLNKSLIMFHEHRFVEKGTVAYDEFMDYGKRLVVGKGDLPDDEWMFGLARVAVLGELTPEELNDTKDYLPFIAWALEAVRLKAAGTISTGLMLRRDATASSIQHMATMAGDVELMERVNLTTVRPKRPSDLYAGLGVGSMARQPLKSFIMTYCYNSTAYGRAKERKTREGGTLKEYMAQDAAIQTIVEPLLANVSIVRDYLGTVVGPSNDWKFTSPSGVSWDGTRYEWPSRQILVRYNQAKIRVRLRTQSGTPESNIRKTRSGFVANVIHSLDAAQLQLAAREWPTSVAFIHDCLVTLPGDMGRTVDALRRSFFTMHKELKQKYENWSIDKPDELDYHKYMSESPYMFV